MNYTDDNEIEQIRLKKKQALLMGTSEKEGPHEIIHLRSIKQFNELLNKYKNKVIVIDCWTEWCGPCKMYGPIFEQVYKEYLDNDVIFIKVNIDELQGFAQHFRIMSIPTTIVIKNKEIIAQELGLLSKDRLETLIEHGLKK
ncbi:MAG: thioredoxin family protein [Promethearchaeota archaeon]